MVLSFAATAVAAITGAALHGLFADDADPRRRALWRISLGAISVGGLSAWRIGVAATFTGTKARLVAAVATIPHALYLAFLTRLDPPYAVAIATYLPGAAMLSIGLVVRLRVSGARRSSAVGLLGLGLTFGAAVAQVRRIALHPRWFDHNATYHAIQAAAIACFYAASRGLVAGFGRQAQATGRR